jgi:hypothetical protein
MKPSQKQQITSKGKAADQIEDSPAASCSPASGGISRKEF